MKIKSAPFIYSYSALFVLYPSLTEAANNIPMPSRLTANWTADNVCNTDTPDCLGFTKVVGFDNRDAKCSIWWNDTYRQNIILKAKSITYYFVRSNDRQACVDMGNEWPDGSKVRHPFRACKGDFEKCK